MALAVTRTEEPLRPIVAPDPPIPPPLLGLGVSPEGNANFGYPGPEGQQLRPIVAPDPPIRLALLTPIFPPLGPEGFEVEMGARG